MNKEELIKRGSQTAKDGFSNEVDISDKFSNWKEDTEAKKWLEIMGYKLNEIEKVEAIQVKGSYKTDVQVKITIFLKKIISHENISIKLVSNPKGFNQIDKRWVDKYAELWNVPSNVRRSLKLFTGELSPVIKDVRDERRMFLDELDIASKEELLSFFRTNKILIISDLIKGRGKFSADWMLVVLKVDGSPKWVLKDINQAMNIFGQGDVLITAHGNLKIGNIGMQRKGGDNGRDSARMLQFKVNPVILF